MFMLQAMLSLFAPLDYLLSELLAARLMKVRKTDVDLATPPLQVCQISTWTEQL